MKLFLTLIAGSLLAANIRAATSSSDLLAQIHFAGAQNILAGKNAAAFTNQFNSTEALALRVQTADKASVWLAAWLQRKLPVTVADGAAKLRPLLDDLQVSEWYLEAHGSGSLQVAIVIRLDAVRAALWETNLKLFFPAACFKGQAGWLVFASAPEALPWGNRLAENLPATNTAWLTADMNWPQLAVWYPPLKSLDLPETQGAVTADGVDLQIDGKFIFKDDVASHLAPWQTPTNILSQRPLVSFTALRGISGWLKNQSWAQSWLFTPAPDQIFAWVPSQEPLQLYVAAPCADTTGALAQVYARLQPVFDPKTVLEKFAANFRLMRTDGEISIVGAPFIQPKIRVLHETSGDFLLANLFLDSPPAEPPSPELFRRLAEKNLVFYHWENTAERMPQVINSSELGLMLTLHRQMDRNSAAMKWIQKMLPGLGNSVTAITQTGPQELTFTRKAKGGLTALELFLLGYWLESPDFPHCNFRLADDASASPAPRAK